MYDKQEGKKQRQSFPSMDWNFDGNEYDPLIPNDYERVVRGKRHFWNVILSYRGGGFYFVSSTLLSAYRYNFIFFYIIIVYFIITLVSL